MQTWKRRSGLFIAAALILGIVYVAFMFKFLGFVVDYWWFESLGYKWYFLLRLIYKDLIFLGVVVAFFLTFFLNFWIASRFLGSTETPESEKNAAAHKSYRRLLKMFQTGSMTVYTPLSLLMAVPIAIPFYEKWEQALLYFYSMKSGVPDPRFGKDVSYYLFSLPIYDLIQNRLFVVFLILFGSLFLLYWLERRLLAGKDQSLPNGAKIHLTLLFLTAFLIQGWDYMLQRYSLLYTATHQPLFFGPGFVEMWYHLPLIWLKMASLTGVVISLVFYVHRRKGIKWFFISGVLFVLSLVGWKSPYVPNLLDQYVVKPNEVVRERPFIESSIKATLAAYKLGNVNTRRYDIRETGQIFHDWDVQQSLPNIPVWDRELLINVYKQLQEIRPYYAFPSVDVDRYTVKGRYQQVYLAARELDIRDLPDYAQNWPNRHLQYTHGYGVVMTPAVQGGDETMTWFIRGLPPESDYGLSVQNPAIYYGKGGLEYAIVPNDVGEIDYPKEEGEVLSNYAGEGGIAISGFVKKLLFATYFKDRNILFTTKTNRQSRIIFRRNIRERIHKITPFFILDEDPYLVVSEQGLFWIQDGYTISDRYPNAEPCSKNYNYIRNSVKIVVDAYNGSIDYYISDAEDPIVNAYKRMYPGLLKPLDRLSADLKKHLRYPKDIFEAQLEIYAKYHQTDPEMFYRQEDNWEFAKMVVQDQTIHMKPYYMTLDLLKPGSYEFMLLNPMVPVGRNNLRALAIAGCDNENYGKIEIYTFPKGMQVNGPSQVSALIDQDTKISEQITLWGQVGSEVTRGRMRILPVSNKILYIQPVYLSSSTKLKIPELKRLIVSNGQRMAMDASLEGAFLKLEAEQQESIDRKKKRFDAFNFDTSVEPPAARDSEAPGASPDISEKSAEPEPSATPPANAEL